MLRISTSIRDEDRFYLQNLLQSGQGELPDENGKISKNATHRLLLSKGFIVGAEKVIKKSIDKGNKK